MCGTIMSMGSVVENTGAATFLAGLITDSGIMSLNFVLALGIMARPAVPAPHVLPHRRCHPWHLPACSHHHVRRLRGVPRGSTIALAVVVAGNYIAPVNPTVMLTFGEGYFTFGDMVKTGIVPAIALIVIMSLWMPFICGALGI